MGGRASRSSSAPPPSSASTCWLAVVCPALTQAMPCRPHHRHPRRLKPDYADAHCDLGCTYCAQGDMDNAKRCFKHAIRCAPHHLEAHFNMGNLYRQCAEFGRAIQRWGGSSCQGGGVEGTDAGGCCFGPGRNDALAPAWR